MGDFEHPVPLEGAHANAGCSDCHTEGRELTGDCADCHEPPSEPHFGPNCEDCHTPTGLCRCNPAGRAAPGGAGGCPPDAYL